MQRKFVASKYHTIILLSILAVVGLVIFQSSIVDVHENELPSTRLLRNEEDVKLEMQIEKAREEDNKSSFTLIPLNLSSSLYTHIISIRHYPKLAKVDIKISGCARCPKPVLFGRLSGKTLSVMEWDPPPPPNGPNNESAGCDAKSLQRDPYIIHELETTITGHYSVPTTGQYFIEIIILYCKDFDDLIFADQMTSKCLEAPGQHRLTDFGASILVEKNDPNAATLGYWSSPAETPLYTRFQPANCRPPNDQSQRCQTHISTRPFSKYQFIWDRNQVSPIKNVIYGDTDNYTENCAARSSSDKQCRLCTVGASHSRRLFRYLHAIHVTDVGYYDFKYPHEITSDVALEILNTCPKILFGFGQWSASWYYPTSPAEFGEEMKRMLGLFASSSSPPGVVHVRSVHKNPLGDIQLKCPAKDFRTPPIIDRYNAIVKDVVCRELDIPFLDTSFIIDPMWDSSWDWNHVNEKVQIVEAQYFASYFGLL